MRLLFIAYHYPPLGGGGVQRSVKFVRYLSQFGYEPVVVTGPGGAKDLWTPEDRTLEDQLPPGIEVHRVPGPEPPQTRSRTERMLGIRSDFDDWWTEGAYAVGREVGRGVDLVFGELVPYTTAEPAARLARELGKPWVADLQDPWALDEMWLYPTGLHRWRDARRMRRFLGSADATIMNTPEAAVRLQGAFPEFRERLVASIPNGFDETDYLEEAPPPAQDAFRIAHAGYLHTDLGLKHRRSGRLRRLLGGTPVPGIDFLTRTHVFLLEAVDRLLERDPSLASYIEIHLAGVLTEVDKEVAARSPVVRLHGYITHPETIRLLKSADLLFLPMHDLPLGTRAGLTPGKTYEYLATGTPILAAVPDGDARELLEEAGNAFICRPADSEAMAEIIAGQIERKRRGEPPPLPRSDVLARYERRRQTQDLANVFDRVLGRRASVERDEAART
jgi:glycosyltransferase involved in cell wall biosynthesis